MPKYHSIDTIPAKVFFEILESKNYQLLRPKPREKGLEEIFIAIYDERFIRAANPNAEEYLELTNRIKITETRIFQIKRIVHFLFYTPTTREIRYKWLDYLKEKQGITVDRDKPFIDEVERVLQQEVGIIENDLNQDKMRLEALRDNHDKQMFDYYDSIAGLSDVHGRTLDEQMSLAMYTALEKSAVKKIDKQRIETNKKQRA